MTSGTERPPAGTGASVPHERLVVAGVPILIEAGSVLMPTFGAPDWLFRVYALVVIAGFLIALVISPALLDYTVNGRIVDRPGCASERACPRLPRSRTASRSAAARCD